MTRNLFYSNEALRITVGNTDYVADVYAKATLYKGDQRPWTPPEDEFEIKEIEIEKITCIDEDGNVITITGNEFKMVSDSIFDYLNNNVDEFNY